MAHFAEVRTDTNEVLRVIVINNKDVDANGGDYSAGAEAWVTNLMANAQSESIKELYGGSYPSDIYWKQCSYNKNNRGIYPGVGCKYNASADRFEGPQYFPSWTLNETTFMYEAPVPEPSGEHGDKYLQTAWDEDNQRWNGNTDDENYIWNPSTSSWEDAQIMANGGIVGPSITPTLGDLITPFTGSGTFNRSKTTGTVLVVAGGGEGGPDIAGGGGGGGLILSPSSFPLPATATTITIGGGGSPSTPHPTGPEGPTNQGGNGVDSSFGTALVAIGGGGGGTYFNTGHQPGAPGGSGGGGRRNGGSGGSGTQPQAPGNSGPYGFGNGGATGTGPDSSGYAGGAGGAGGSGSSQNGGSSKSIPAFPSDYGLSGAYAGGGSGGGNPPQGGPAAGNSGGGGAGGGNVPYANGQANTGGGGKGKAPSSTSPPDNGTGGSGIVLVKEEDVLQNTSGKWTLQEVFKFVKQGKWSN